MLLLALGTRGEPCPRAYYLHVDSPDALRAPALDAALGAWGGRAAYGACARCEVGCARCLRDGRCTACLRGYYPEGLARAATPAPVPPNATGVNETDDESGAPSAAKPATSCARNASESAEVPWYGLQVGFAPPVATCDDVLAGNAYAPPDVVARCQRGRLCSPLDRAAGAASGAGGACRDVRQDVSAVSAIFVCACCLSALLYGAERHARALAARTPARAAAAAGDGGLAARARAWRARGLGERVRAHAFFSSRVRPVRTRAAAAGPTTEPLRAADEPVERVPPRLPARAPSPSRGQ